MGHNLEDASLKYERALIAGAARVAVGSTPAEQARRWRQGVERNCETSRLVRALLTQLGVPRLLFVNYIGFGLQLDKHTRRYSGATLQMLARELVVQWAARGLTPSVLRAICRQAFDVSIE
ncbi:MAG: hypothetical protein NTX53_05585 [candidate division WOR-3 bacterium]|nr:hypothetical protein [candidate division WOR-3 bacterium]